MEKQNESKMVSDADIITGNPEVGMITAYDGNGSEVILTENTDGTYLTGDGTTYYLGKDGIYHSKGKADMYVNKPQTSDNGSSGAISQDQALAAIKKYCFASDPGLEEMVNSGDVYVTELVPGIIDDEQRTDEKFNIKDYMAN
ncbi:MAG: hypothetical protein II966_07530 [Lachnospiraceae bacterium]|nr:hypothetical protein [Lachnospiraceae bacterium]